MSDPDVPVQAPRTDERPPHDTFRAGLPAHTPKRYTSIPHYKCKCGWCGSVQQMGTDGRNIVCMRCRH